VVELDDTDRVSAARERSAETHLNIVGGPKPAPDLKTTLRRARIENAERSDVITELRGAEIARLEMLEEQLQPVLAQVREDCDLFDVALVASEHPRLFIDTTGFVEMGRDRRLYRFLQDTRHGRITLSETEQLDKMVEAVTNYIAQRLIERARAPAADANARALSGDDETDGAPGDGAAPVSPRRKRNFAVRFFVFSSISSAWRCSSA
jgi:hypothetical protein